MSEGEGHSFSTHPLRVGGGYGVEEVRNPDALRDVLNGRDYDVREREAIVQSEMLYEIADRLDRIAAAMEAEGDE